MASISAALFVCRSLAGWDTFRCLAEVPAEFPEASSLAASPFPFHVLLEEIRERRYYFRIIVDKSRVVTGESEKLSDRSDGGGSRKFPNCINFCRIRFHPVAPDNVP